MVTKLKTFEFNNKAEDVKFLETIQVTKGVFCDVYAFENDTAKDLAIVKVEAGCDTPLQRVLKGEKTIEGYISGKGRLIITKSTNEHLEYVVNETIEKHFEIAVEIGDIMQWIADKTTPLKFYEICFPPYEEGRYENL